ncbi:MAG: transposase [Chitinophagaceae bacterium]
MTVASNTLPLISGEVYHIYNRAISKEKLFIEDQDHVRFLKNIKDFILPHSQIYAYCLLNNHFHLLLRINNADQFSKKLADASNSYSRYFNIKYNRRGGLFMRPFKRKLIKDDANLSWITWYIHQNPLHHKLTEDWQNWKWSSYKAYTSDSNTLLDTTFLLDFFGDREAFIKHHQINLKAWIQNAGRQSF